MSEPADINQLPSQDNDSQLPGYDDLPFAPGTSHRVAWPVFGVDDELGTLNLLTDDRRRDACRLVNSGRTINLDHPLNLPLRIFGHRRPYVHNIFEIMPGYQDETIDDFSPQMSSQWDALRHVRSPIGYYGGATYEDVSHPGGRLGIDRVAKFGIVGRGVLLDVASYYEELGSPIEPNVRREIPAVQLDAIAEHQGVVLHTGDILLIRFGVDAFLRRLIASDGDIEMRYEAPGLAQEEQTVRWLWNRHVAAVCADNIAIEVTPPRGPDTRLHPVMIGSIGLAMGELFDLVDLANVCQATGRYEFLFIGKPLNLPGGVGSPANALAMF